MGLIGQYVDSIKSNFSNAGTSLSKVADKPKDNSILGRIFGGLKNLGDAAIHATAGLTKIALPIAAGVALVSLGPVGWIGLGALALTLLGGDPKPAKVNEPAKDGTPPTADAPAPAAGETPPAPPAADGAAPPAPSGGAPKPEKVPVPINPKEAAEAAKKAAEATADQTAKAALNTASTALTKATTAITDPKTDKTKAATEAKEASKTAADAATAAEAKDKKAAEALHAASKALTEVATALNAIATKPADAAANPPVTQSTAADISAAERVNTLITELSEEVDAPTYNSGLLYDAEGEYGKLTETQQKLIPQATKEKLTKLLAQVA